MIDQPEGDLARTKTHEPNSDFPDEVQLRLVWIVNGSPRIRSVKITAEQFFGRGGAPLTGDAIIAHIERMRRKGPPEVQYPARKRRR
jgi:hypothetical protein